MKKTTIYKFFALGIIISVYFIFLRNLDEKTLMKRGNVLISKIEEYRQEEGELPIGYNELDLKEVNTNELFYQKVDSINYILWFGTSLGESMIYYSDSKEWEKVYREIKK